MSKPIRRSYHDYFDQAKRLHDDQIKGVTFKALAEGDSWFHFNRLAIQESLLLGLRFSHPAILVNTAKSGDTMRDIMTAKHIGRIKKMLDAETWNLLLWSGGGNDVIDAIAGIYPVGNQVRSVLNEASTVAAGSKDNPLAYVNAQELKVVLEEVTRYYDQLAEIKMSSVSKGARVILHNYDYATIRNFKGSDARSYKALTAKNIPPTLWNGIVDHVLDQLGMTLEQIADRHGFEVARTKGVLKRAELRVGGKSNDWRNDIHPTQDGYNKLCDQVVNKLL